LGSHFTYFKYQRSYYTSTKEKNNVAFSRKDVILKNIIGMVKSGKAPISEDEMTLMMVTQ
jgi:hypothetical protein